MFFFLNGWSWLLILYFVRRRFSYITQSAYTHILSIKYNFFQVKNCKKKIILMSQNWIFTPKIHEFATVVSINNILITNIWRENSYTKNWIFAAKINLKILWLVIFEFSRQKSIWMFFLKYLWSKSYLAKLQLQIHGFWA